MRAWLAAWMLLATLAPLAAPAQDGQRPAVGVTWEARVTHVVDGDSLWAQPARGGARVRLRIDGIDAPEICQPLGRQSRSALQALVLNRRVRVSIRAYDRYGRALVSVRRLADDVDAAAHMVSQGWAWSDSHRAWLSSYWREELVARHHGRGVFAERWPETPAEFRRRHGPCVTR